MSWPPPAHGCRVLRGRSGVSGCGPLLLGWHRCQIQQVYATSWLRGDDDGRRRRSSAEVEQFYCHPCSRALVLSFAALGLPSPALLSPPLPENATLFRVLSLCLSRACLGKIITFSIEWRKKRRSPTSSLPSRGALLLPAPPESCTVAIQYIIIARAPHTQR